MRVRADYGRPSHFKEEEGDGQGYGAIGRARSSRWRRCCRLRRRGQRRSYEHCWPLFEGYGGRLAGRSEGMDDLEGAVTARIEEDGRLIVSCNEPGCEHEFELRPLHLPQDTGSLADAFNAGWQISSDEATPDFCPQHSGTSA